MKRRTAAPSPMTAEQLAHKAVADAIKAGTLTKPATCELCDQPPRYAHHHSYAPEHQLDVAWVCASHHGLIHSGKVPEPRTGVRRAVGQRICFPAPSILIERLAGGSRVPPKSKHMARWQWAALFAAAHPMPQRPAGVKGMDIFQDTAPNRAYWRAYERWKASLPQSWDGLDLRVVPERIRSVREVQTDLADFAGLVSRHNALCRLLDQVDLAEVA